MSLLSIECKKSGPKPLSPTFENVGHLIHTVQRGPEIRARILSLTDPNELLGFYAGIKLAQPAKHSHTREILNQFLAQVAERLQQIELDTFAGCGASLDLPAAMLAVDKISEGERIVDRNNRLDVLKDQFKPEQLTVICRVGGLKVII